MKLYVTYELSPYTAGGVGTYFNHIVRLASEKQEKIGLLFGLPVGEVAKMRSDIAVRLDLSNPPLIFSAFELAKENTGPNIFWNRSRLFCEAILKLEALHEIEYIEFVDYCGPAYHFLLEKSSNVFQRKPKVGIRVHNSIEIIDRAAGLMKAAGPECPYGLERAALSLADTVLIPGHKFWEKCGASKYNIDPKRIVQSPPPFARNNLPTVHPSRSGIAFVGRPSILKGFDTFFEALCIVQAKLRIGEFPSVTIIGPPETVVGALNLKEELAKNGDLQSKIVNLGHLSPSELQKTIGSFDILVFPNRSESYCYTLHEAVLAGCRIIANSIPAFEEHLSVSQRIQLFDGTPADLATKLQSMLQSEDSFDRDTHQQLVQQYLTRSRLGGDAGSEESSGNTSERSAALVLVTCTSEGGLSDVVARNWATCSPADQVLSALEIPAQSNCENVFVVTSNSVASPAPDQWGRARQILCKDRDLQCVLIYSQVLDRTIVEVGIDAWGKFPSLKPSAVVWRFDRVSEARDHLALGLQHVTDPPKLRALGRCVSIGVSDHPSARNYALPVAMTKLMGATSSSGVTIGEAEERLREMSLARPTADLCFVVRGHVRVGPDVKFSRKKPLIEPLFGFFPTEGGDLETWFGGIALWRDEAPFEFRVVSETAELWTFRNGLKTVHFLKTGSATLLTQEYGAILSDCCEETLETGAIIDYGNREVSVAVGDARGRKFYPSELVFAAQDLQDARFYLFGLRCSKVTIGIEGRLLSDGSCHELLAAARFIQQLEVCIVVPSNLFFCQDWHLHMALLAASAIQDQRLRVRLFAEPALASALRSLCFECEDLPGANPRKPARKWFQKRPTRRDPTILLSSSGTFAGHFGHVLSALAILRHERPYLRFAANLLTPNDHSEQLVNDLNLRSSVTIFKNGVPLGQKHDIVVEVFPDGPLSTEAQVALAAGAHGVVSYAAGQWIHSDTPLELVGEWEASDVIADALYSTIKRWLEGA